MPTATAVAPTDDLLDETLRVFQPRTERRLTREDAREMVHNLTGCFRVLAEWDQRERDRQAALRASDGLPSDDPPAFDAPLEPPCSPSPSSATTSRARPSSP